MWLSLVLTDPRKLKAVIAAKEGNWGTCGTKY